MSEPRKHHYVPVFYQRQFTNAKGLVWVYDRHLQTYKELPPPSLCFKKDLYALRPKNAPKDQRIESQVMSYVDGVSASAIRDLLSGHATEETFDTLAYFLAVQFNRLPSFGTMVSELYTQAITGVMHTMAADVGRMQEVIDRYAKTNGASLDASAQSMVDAVQGNHIEVVATERPFLHHLFSQAEDISKVILALDWQILMAPLGTGFIYNDSPMVIVPPEGQNSIGFGVPGAVKYFPLSRERCLRLGDPGQLREFRKISKDTLQIINYNLAANSDRFAMGPDKAQLQSVIRRSQSEQKNTTPRWLVQTTEHKDGGTTQITMQPRRYFYGKDSKAP